MCKIGILLLDRDFEHDVYELIKAFYPEGDIHSLYEKDEEEYDIFFTVEKDEKDFIIRYETKDKKGAARAAVITGADLKEESSEAKKPEDGAQESPKIMDAHELRKANKDGLKYVLYNVLVKLTGRTLPWGNLTGIRPAKLAMGMIESGMKNTEIAQVMRDHYLVSAKKTALAITIANRERALLQDIDYEHGYSLYVGIPFCPSICLYCSFSSYPLKIWHKRVDEYLDALCLEIQETAKMMKNYKLDTIYIGGGTPTTLEPDQLRRLLDQLGECRCRHILPTS